MLDFTSALYLGLRHARESLRPWAQLALGVPAALAPPPGAEAVADRLATLQGCERGTLAPSTLHLFWDLFGILASRGVIIYLDDGAYPIARWGVERAAARGMPVRRFPHHDAEALRRLLKQETRLHRSPLVVADGFCPACGRPAPIAAYLDSVRSLGGLLVLDDTQALGILGHSRGPDAPYGRGGGGSLRWHNVSGPDVLLVSSLAKGFGVPVAVLAGSSEMVRHFEERSETRVHCSPPSVAVVHAAEHALAVNQAHGDALRLRLAQQVRHFRQRLAEVGLSATGGLFPVQTLDLPSGFDARIVHRRLLDLGMRTVLRRKCGQHDACISTILTVRHRPDEIGWVVNAMAAIATIAPQLQLEHR